MKEIKINIPEGFEVDTENSDLSNGKIVFKELEEEYNKTWEDLIGTPLKKGNVYITNLSTIEKFSEGTIEKNYMNTFVDEKTAKSALAMARISMLIPYYGGKITNEEWKDDDVNKFVIARYVKEYNEIKLGHGVSCWTFLAFHTRKQRDNFLKYNEQLVKDYLMIE